MNRRKGIYCKANSVMAVLYAVLGYGHQSMEYERLFVRVVCLGFLLFWPIAALTASQPQFWELATQDEFLKGRLQGVSLTTDGKLVPAPRYEALFDSEQTYLFSLTSDGKGNLYAGSGHDGKVFKIGPDKKGTLFFKAKELDIFALAVDAQNNLYVGTSPDGKVYKVAPDGTGKEFFDPKEKYIWAMAFGRDGSLYLATGSRGILYKVNKSGEGTRFFESDATHLVSLTADLAGNLIAGSSPNGYVYQIAPDGKAFVLYDSGLNEIRSLAVDRIGNVVGVALSESSSSALESSGPTKGGIMPGAKGSKGMRGDELGEVLSVSSSSSSKSDSAPPGSPLPAELIGVKSYIFQIAKDATITRLWASKEDVVYSVLTRDDGNVLAGTATKGRILSISPARRATILVESPEEQVTAMYLRDNALYAATSNLGKVFQLRPERTQEGFYESEVKDTRMISSWGVISWKVDGARGQTVELYTRSGNTRKPNKTWSDWAGPYKVSEGDAVKSPRARYIQWKALFKGGAGSAKLISEENALERVSIAYLQQNVAPRVTSINVMAPGTALQKMPALVPSLNTVGGPGNNLPSVGGAGAAGVNRPRIKTPPQPRPQPGARSITWRADDENEDELSYQLFFRADGTDAWKLLEKDLTDDFFTLDSTTLPDGIYQVKVVASDAPSNAYGKALTGEMVSRPFVIDNTPPVIELGPATANGRRAEIGFTVRDTTSKILTAEFSIDGSEWRQVFPKDGIADSKIESYQLSVDNLTPGDHTIALKATDAMGNAGANKATVKVK